MCQICAAMRPFDDTCEYEQFLQNSHNLNSFVETIDAPAGPHSFNDRGVMTVDSTFDGAISFVGDSDWIRVSLTQGETYTISMFSYSMETFLALADNNGSVLVTDDFEVVNYEGVNIAVSTFEVTATRTGDYYVIAEESGVNSIGGYTVGVFSEQEGQGDLEKWSLGEIADQLTTEGWSFFNNGPREFKQDKITYNISELNSKSKKLAEFAFDSWAKLTGLKFKKVTGDALIDFTDDEDGAFAGSVVKPNGFIESSRVNISTDWEPGFGHGLDSYLFQTYIHEIGHALGLAHAGNYDASTGGASFPDTVLYENDSWNVTVMSYIDQDENTKDKADKAFVMTPMIADIIAIQNLYGAPNKAYHGDTKYGVGSNTGDYMDIIFSAITDKNFTHNLILGDRPMSFTLWDTGGKDTVNLRTDKKNQRIDLGEKQLSDIYGVKGAMVIAKDTVIENYTAGSGNDKVTGNGAKNTLKGNDGADKLFGQSGADNLQGGGGKDKLFGGKGGDALFGGGAKDVLHGQIGDDVLTGGAGSDEFMFAKKGDFDRVLDFKNNEDTLVLDDNLWSGNKTKQQILNKYGNQNGDNAVLNFGDGDRILIKDMRLGQLKDDMEFV